MNLAFHVRDVLVQDPFEATPRHGADVRWAVRDLSDEGRRIEGPMGHWDAMRVLLKKNSHLVMRDDADPSLVVTGRSFSSNHASGSPIDVTPALATLEMQDFVDLLAEDFGPGPISAHVLDILDRQGDPRAQRLVLYATDWSTPDEKGHRPEARLQISQDGLMGWLKARRPEIHDELTYRMRPPGPSLYD